LLILQGSVCTQTKNEEREFSPAIEDNSFFIEEAYNQEERVVQHISNASYFKKPVEEIVFSFTQEWPLASQSHQLSATIPYSSIGSGSASGINDIMINYRYQLSNDPHKVVIAPRLSVILPTGNSNQGLGSGVVGWQLNLPMSKRFSDAFIAHTNAGVTLLPQVKGADSFGNEVKQTLLSYNTGLSLIWLASYHYNVMLEIAENFISELGGTGSIVHTNETIISPGFRYAVDVNELQIVPGLALPISIQQGESRTGLFFYLSFEHPF
jgi:hypothetical protein